jgi:16S rRNA G527 N7-methylase RsmG
MIVRDDLGAVLIESKEKKTRFLESTVVELGIANRVEIINRQFAETTLTGVSLVTCRALDRFVDVVSSEAKSGSQKN